MTSYPSVWHPFTQLQDFTPRGRVVNAQDAWLDLEDGTRVFDGISSWWVNVHGHAHPRITQAIADQAARFGQVILADFTHPPAEQLTSRIVARLPGDLDHLFFSDDGSTSVEVALKMATQVQQIMCGKRRHRFVAFQGAYHGDTAGAMSVGERCLFNEPFADLLFDVDFLPWNDTNALETWMSEHGQEVIAVIVEPLIQGAAGMRFCTSDFLRRLNTACRQSGALWIADEVFTGFGRTGSFWAVNHADLVPDILCMSKGITGGTMTLGATACRKHIFDCFLGEKKVEAFLHGHSYTGNPIACAASLASLDLFDEEDTLGNVAALEAVWAAAAPRLRALPQVAEVRWLGGVIAFEVTGGRGDYLDPIGHLVADIAWAEHLYIRPLGNTIYLLPPLATPPTEAEWALDVIIRAVDQALETPPHQ